MVHWGGGGMNQGTGEWGTGGIGEWHMVCRGMRANIRQQSQTADSYQPT